MASGARHEIRQMSSCVKPTGNVSPQGQSQSETASSIYLIKNKETKKLYKPSEDHQWVTLFYKNPTAHTHTKRNPYINTTVSQIPQNTDVASNVKLGILSRLLGH